MPGIAGIISCAPADDCKRLVRSMIKTMREHGPYRYGTRFFPELGIYGGWVAHAESFAERACGHRYHSGGALLLAGEYLSAAGPHATFDASRTEHRFDEVE